MIVRSLAAPASIRRFRNVPIDTFVAAVEEWGHGLYVVGLDIHVGFVACEEQGVCFLHSSYVDPLCVVCEKGAESRVLAASRYRVLGKLTGEDAFAVSWRTGTPITTKTK
jgi:hypothetical protein